MTFDELEEAFVARLRANWTDPNVPVYIDNQVFQPSDSYAQMFLLSVGIEGIGFTGNHKVEDRQNGVLQFNNYTNVGIGAGEGKRIGSQLGLLFSNVVFSGIHCMTYTVRSFGTDEGKYRVVTEVPFFWYLNSTIQEV